MAAKRVYNKGVKKEQTAPRAPVCAICGRTPGQIKRFIGHHIRYEGEFGPEIKVDVCFVCHERLHGRRVWSHPFDKKYGKDIGPYVFSKAVARLYEDGWMNGPGEWLGSAIIKINKKEEAK